MSDARYGPKDALAAVEDRTLEDWLNSWWDLLCGALNSYQASLDLNSDNDKLTIEAIRRVRMEIVVGNRLSDCIHNRAQPLQPPQLPGIYAAGQAELTEHLPDVAARG